MLSDNTSTYQTAAEELQLLFSSAVLAEEGSGGSLFPRELLGLEVFGSG